MLGRQHCTDDGYLPRLIGDEMNEHFKANREKLRFWPLKSK